MFNQISLAGMELFKQEFEVSTILSEMNNEDLYIMLNDNKHHINDEIESVFEKALFNISYSEEKSKQLLTCINNKIVPDRLKIVETLLKGDTNGTADPNFQEEYYNHLPPLFWAIHSNNEELVKLLINYGANVNAQSPKGSLLMYSTTFKCEPGIINVLLEYGANANFQDNDGWTPLYFAVINKNIKIIKILLEYQANPNVLNNNQWSPLYAASGSKENLEIIQLLLKHGADLTLGDENGYTPLHRAIFWNQPEIVELFLNHIATLRKRSKNASLKKLAQSALQFAEEQKNTKIKNIIAQFI